MSWLALLLLGLLPWLPGAAFQDPEATRPRSQVPGDAPSDPAALGFLRGYVDQRVHHLGQDLAATLTSTASVTVETPLGESETLDFALTLQLPAGITSLVPTTPPRQIHARYVDVCKQMARTLVTVSNGYLRGARDYVVTLRRDGDEVTLQYLPRAPSPVRFETRFTADGRPSRTTSRFPSGLEDLEKGTLSGLAETTYEHAEIDGKLVLEKETQVLKDLRATTTYEYESIDGHVVLKKARADGFLSSDVSGKWQLVPWIITVEYATTITPRDGP